MTWLVFILGITVGVAVGFTLASLFVASEDDRSDRL